MAACSCALCCFHVGTFFSGVASLLLARMPAPAFAPRPAGTRHKLTLLLSTGRAEGPGESLQLLAHSSGGHWHACQRLNLLRHR